MDWNTNELKIPLNGKDYISPVTMHKVKNKLEVNCANITPECDDSSTSDCILQNSQNSQNSQNFGGKDTLKKT